MNPRFCTACGGRGRIIEVHSRSKYVHRRYSCMKCKTRWSSREVRL